MSSGCISQTYSDSLRNQFYLAYPQQIIIYIVMPFIYMAGIFNIVFFLKGKNRAEPPADILLFITVFGMIRAASYLAGTIYEGVYPPSQNAEIPSSFDSMCSGTGFINVLCQTAGFIYNVVFCIYYLIKIKNPLKSWNRSNKQIHIICIVIIVTITLVFYLTNLIGISILGICGYRIGQHSIYLDLLFSVCYFIILIISSIFFVKYLRTISQYENDNKVYFRFYYKYLIITAIFHLVGLVSLMVPTILCTLDASDVLFQVFTTICNLTRLLTPVMVFIVLLNHPQIRLSKLLRFFNSCLKRKNQQIKQVDSFYSDLMTTKRTSIMIELSQLNNQNMQKADYLSKIKDKSKACLINTILGCISLNQNQKLKYSQTQNIMLEDQQKQSENIIQSKQESIRFDDLRFSSFKNSTNKKGNQELFGWNFKEKYQFELNQDIVTFYKGIFNEKIPVIQLKFISFGNSVFKALQLKDKVLNLHQKLLPIKNQKNILQNVQTDGGRSGQFFFFNYDSTFIIKTVTSDELRVLIDRLEAYYDYFQRNQQSFIVKIFGLYKAINVQTAQQISFMLMGNLLKNIPKKYVLRSYDMKGSTHQRRVLKQQQMNNQSAQIKKTLKDIDFHILQGKIHISQADSLKIKKVLEQDSLFLYSQKLIDYSLLVLKIDYALLLKQNEINMDQFKIYKSVKDQGVVYMFGIIDYLQTWNIRKKGQKWYKSMFNKTQHISSQDPKFYAERFMRNLVQLIL